MHDVVIVGGGLSGGLLAWSLKTRIPDIDLVVIDSQEQFGGNHTWCFFDTDLSADQRRLIAPFVSHRWSSYDVHFPSSNRLVESAYAAVSSQQFNAVLSDKLKPFLVRGIAQSLTSSSVQLDDGGVLHGKCIIDARGVKEMPALTLGFQKFAALEIETTEPHGLARPIIMDATVSQIDGYRFFYTLPFGPKCLLIYDTYYSDAHDIDLSALHRRIRDYANFKNWKVSKIVREEKGVLPIVMAGEIDDVLAKQNVPTIGLAAGLFHSSTGYSLSYAVKVADLMSKMALQSPLTTDRARAILESHVSDVWRKQGFYRMLNRILFRAAIPRQRYRILERFYGLNKKLIERYYAGQLTRYDKVRLLVGKPPVSIFRALASLPEASVRTA